MSLGSRAIERGRHAIFKTVCPASTPREPRLFLYPRLFGTTTPPEKRHVPIASHQPDTIVERNSNTGEPLRDEEASRGTLQKKTETITQAIPFDGSSKEVEDNSDRIRRVRAKLLNKQQARRDTDEYEERTWQRYRAARRADDSEEVDWRRVFSLLFQNTPEGVHVSHDDGVRVIVPSTAVETLLFDVDNNIWRMKERTGCNIYLLPVEPGTEDTRTFLLSGLSEHISRACEEMQRVVPNCVSNSVDATKLSALGFNTSPVLSPSSVRSLPPQSVMEDSTEGPVEGPPSISRSLRAVRAERHGELAEFLDNLQEPSSWTRSTFEHYVLRLIKSKESSFRRWVPSNDNPERCLDHIERVRARLNDLFENPKFHNVISTTAFHLALAYFIKTGQIMDARRLFVGMEIIGLRMETETFNIMFRAAAKIHDLHNFAFLLGMMLKRGYQPDGGSWLAFLSTITNFEIKTNIIAAMRRKGILRQVSVVQALCRELGPFETQWSILREDTHDEFIRHMDKRYGPHWLTTSSANRVLDQLGAHGLFFRCCVFAHFMKSRLVNPNSISLRTVVNHCRTVSNFDGAIHVLKTFSELGIEPDSGTYNDLFYMATDNHMYSFARVVWRYACLNRATTFSMRHTVLHLGAALSYTGQWALPITEGQFSARTIWLQNAGKVIFGFSKLPGTPWLGVNKRSKLSGSRAQTTTQSVNTASMQLKMWARAHMHHDLNVHKRWKPDRSFVLLLEEAYERDMSWKANKIWFKISLKEMVRSAMEIPVTLKRMRGELPRVFW